MLIQLAYPALSLEHWHFASPIFSMVQKACTGLTLKNFAVLVLVIGRSENGLTKNFWHMRLRSHPCSQRNPLDEVGPYNGTKGQRYPLAPLHDTGPLPYGDWNTSRNELVWKGDFSCRLSTSYGCDHWFQLLFRIGLKFRFLSFVSCSIPIASVQNRFV